MMAGTDIFDMQAHLSPYRRLREYGHAVRCNCESCFVHIERAIIQYAPGLLPDDPLVLRLKEQDRMIDAMRRQIEHLRNEIKRMSESDRDNA